MAKKKDHIPEDDQAEHFGRKSEKGFIPPEEPETEPEVDEPIVDEPVPDDIEGETPPDELVNAEALPPPEEAPPPEAETTAEPTPEPPLGGGEPAPPLYGSSLPEGETDAGAYARAKTGAY